MYAYILVYYKDKLYIYTSDVYGHGMYKFRRHKARDSYLTSDPSRFCFRYNTLLIEMSELDHDVYLSILTQKYIHGTGVHSYIKETDTTPLLYLFKHILERCVKLPKSCCILLQPIQSSIKIQGIYLDT